MANEFPRADSSPNSSNYNFTDYTDSADEAPRIDP